MSPASGPAKPGRPQGEDAATAPSVGESSVGYGRPPVQHQFKKHESGNPKGRPKGARGLKAEAAEVLNETFQIGASRKRVSARKAMLLKQREKAIKHGDARAASLLLDFARDFEAEAEARASKADRQAVEDQDRALIEAALRRLAPA